MEEKQKQILWIDDDVNNPELQPDRDALEENGCIITPVINPDALKNKVISQYDCIIIDLSMPVGETLPLDETLYGSRTGLVLMKRIKKEHPNSKIVVYSVFDVPEVRVYCDNNGIKYLIKSNFLSDEFAEYIVKLIKGEKV